LLSFSATGSQSALAIFGKIVVFDFVPND
jgi:hypothetical protein